MSIFGVMELLGGYKDEHMNMETVHTGGGIYILQGDVKSKDGKDILVIVGEEDNIVVTKGSQLHEGAPAFISEKIYNDAEIAEKYYYGYEGDLQIAMVYRDSNDRLVLDWETASSLFDYTTIEAIMRVAKDWWDKIDKLHGWGKYSKGDDTNGKT
jgi:hypothetical protein